MGLVGLHLVQSDCPPEHATSPGPHDARWPGASPAPPCIAVAPDYSLPTSRNTSWQRHSPPPARTQTLGVTPPSVESTPGRLPHGALLCDSDGTLVPPRPPCSGRPPCGMGHRGAKRSPLMHNPAGASGAGNPPPLSWARSRPGAPTRPTPLVFLFAMSNPGYALRGSRTVRGR